MAYLRPSTSASEYANRLTPSAKVPPAGRPNTLSSSKVRCKRAESTRKPRMSLDEAKDTSTRLEPAYSAATPERSSRRVIDTRHYTAKLFLQDGIQHWCRSPCKSSGCS